MLQLFRRPAVLTAFAALLGTLALFRLVRRAPLALAGPVTLDAPTIFLALVLVLGATLAIASDPTIPAQSSWRTQLPVLLFLPLFRIYAVGPIHTALLIAISMGGVACSLWLARSMLISKAPLQQADRRFFLAIALASLGLASSAGIVAACAALLSYAVLPSPSAYPNGWQRWAIAGALPLSIPFVATWLAIGAAIAAGATALAAALWLATILRMVAVLVAEPQNQEPRTQNQFLNKGTRERKNKEAIKSDRAKHSTLSPGHLVIRSSGQDMVTLSLETPATSHQPPAPAPIASIALGVLAPPIAALLIQPVVAQLQAGLTPYGNLSVSPWIGLALLDSGSRGVITAPLLAAALLMVVIGAIVSLLGDGKLQGLKNERTKEQKNKGQSGVSNSLPIPTTDDELLASLLLASHSTLEPPTLPLSHSPTLPLSNLTNTVPWLALLVGERGRR